MSRDFVKGYPQVPTAPELSLSPETRRWVRVFARLSSVAEDPSPHDVGAGSGKDQAGSSAPIRRSRRTVGLLVAKRSSANRLAKTASWVPSARV